MQPDRILIKCLKIASCMDHCWGKKKSHERKMREVELRHELDLQQLALELNQKDFTAQAKLQLAVDALKEFERFWVERMDHILQTRWISDGDKCTQLFFRSFKGLAVDMEIHQVFDHQGVIQTSSWEMIAKAATKFFSGILGQSEGIQDDHLRAIVNRQSKCIFGE